MTPHHYRLITFGCKVNQYESELLRQRLAEMGWAPAASDESCDAVIVNTCSVTNRSDQKCRQTLRSLIRRHPRATVLATGCYAKADPETLRNIPGVVGVFPEKSDVLRHLAAEVGIDLPSSALRETLTGHTTRTRAILKIQDGCDAFCSYCIIPHVRARPRSKPIDEAVSEARTLVAAGHREVVLTGIHLGLYGRDLNLSDGLSQLCEELTQIDGLRRIRLSSIELMEVTDRLKTLIAARDNLCPHLHVSLQSGDDDVLRRMNRRYSAGQFRSRARQLIDDVPGLTLSTDCIVGFPGETEEAFEHTVELCRDVGFSKIHVFPFSPRRGTPAASMPDRPEAALVRSRRDRLLALSDELGLKLRRLFLNKTVEILVESGGAGHTRAAEGLTPEFLRVRLHGCSAEPGRLVSARVSSVEGALMHAEPRA